MLRDERGVTTVEWLGMAAIAVLVIAVLGASLHVLIEYALMFGNFGLPALGVVGAGISNSLVQWFMLLAMVGYSLYDRRFRRFALLVRLWRHRGLFRDALRRRRLDADRLGDHVGKGRTG